MAAAPPWAPPDLPQDLDLPSTWDELPPESLPPNPCGGNIVFPGLVFVHPSIRGLVASCRMFAGAACLFPGSDLFHCTDEHPAKHMSDIRGCCGAAHASFAVQTPAGVLGLSRGSRECRVLHDKLLGLGHQDASDPSSRWQQPDCVWLDVYAANDSVCPEERLTSDLAGIYSLPYKRLVLRDVMTKRPLVLFDFSGGLQGPELCAARKDFAFLGDYPFTLDRQAGSLGRDSRGKQRMLMMGTRAQGRAQLATVGRRYLESAITKGAKTKGSKTKGGKKNLVDGYVVHWDECADLDVKLHWNAVAEAMRRLLPRAFDQLSVELQDRSLLDRLHCTRSESLISDDLIVNNVGASSAYQSPSHLDANDVGWTVALPIKCPTQP